MSYKRYSRFSVKYISNGNPYMTLIITICIASKGTGKFILFPFEYNSYKLKIFFETN